MTDVFGELSSPESGILKQLHSVTEVGTGIRNAGRRVHPILYQMISNGHFQERQEGIYWPV